jgi:predicted amidohydrolase
MDKYKRIAVENQVWLSLGSFPEIELCKTKFGKKFYYVTHFIINEIINDDGKVVSKYRKMHLEFEDPTNSILSKGKDISEPCWSPCGYLGLSVGVDLRYPEIYRRLLLKGAQVLLIPSSFLVKTGSTHWETLLRARAIENQCYVVASAQVGLEHDNDQMGYGHSMVVDPRGDIVG